MPPGSWISHLRKPACESLTSLLISMIPGPGKVVLDSKMGLPDKAAQHYEKSLAFNPAQPVSLLRLAELALRRQDWPEAASLADRGLALDLERKDLAAGLHLVKAVAHGACGDDAAARQARDSALELDVSLTSELGGDDGSTPAKMHEVLKTRLQSAP